MQESKEVAAFHLGALGDLIVTVPALHALRRAAGPRARLVLFAAGAERGALLSRCGACHEAFDLARPDLSALFGEAGALPEGLRARFRGFDAAYVLLRGGAAVAENLRRAGVARVVEVEPRPPEGIREHVVDWLIGRFATERTEDTEVIGNVPGFQVTFQAPRWDSVSSVRSVAKKTDPRRRPRLFLPAVVRVAAEARLRGLGIDPDRTILLHPGSGGERKCWPVERFVELAWGVRARGLEPLFVLGPVEIEARSALVAAVRASGVPLLEAPALLDLAATAARAGRFVGNDGGATHLAAAVGAETIALFGPSDADVWAPRGPRARVVRAPGGDLGALRVEAVLDVLAVTRP